MFVYSIYSYVGVLTPNKVVFGGGALEKQLDLDEVMVVEPP